MRQEFPKEVAGVRLGIGQCPKVGRPHLCGDTSSFGQDRSSQQRQQKSAWALGSVPKLEEPTDADIYFWMGQEFLSK